MNVVGSATKNSRTKLDHLINEIKQKQKATVNTLKVELRDLEMKNEKLMATRE